MGCFPHLPKLRSVIAASLPYRRWASPTNLYLIQINQIHIAANSVHQSFDGTWWSSPQALVKINAKWQEAAVTALRKETHK